MPDDFRADRVGSALAGTNPTVLRRMRAGFAVIGDLQHLPGYCVLITDTPGADQLTDLPPGRQLAFLEDLAILGRTVAAVCSRRDPQFRRINLEIQGNTDAFLHAHVTPRYSWEPADLVGWPAALHHWTDRSPLAPTRSGPLTTTCAASSPTSSTASSPRSRAGSSAPRRAPRPAARG